jgi:predicted phage terminase large subunit-like protein
MALSSKQLLEYWEEFRANIVAATPVDKTETPSQQKSRIAKLEANHEAWFKYYFPNFYECEPAPFHIRATKRIMSNGEWYEVRNWSRELAKSTRSMFEDLKMMLTKKKKYKLLISNSFDNACQLLTPYMLILESNQRIINDYGLQQKPGSWETGNLTSRAGFSIRALGAGQSPRGTRKNEVRPDIIEFDDFDTDEECRNPEIIAKKWKWVEQAVIPTRSVSKPTLIRWNGNIIAKDCCIVRAQEFADHVDTVNIRDQKGKSTWPSKNTEAHIKRVLSLISYFSQQKEYYNNPIDEGTVFKEMAYKRTPALNQFRFLVCYTDPSFKESKKNDYKAVVLVGLHKGEFFIIKAFVDQTSTAKMVDWYYQIMDLVAGKTSVYFFCEGGLIQELVMKAISEIAKKKGRHVPMKSDDRKKPDKFSRIESLLEPLNSNGQLYLNELEKDNPHMKILVEQFKALGPGSRAHDDAPDAVEGAVFIINSKIKNDVGNTMIGKRLKNPKRF